MKSECHRAWTTALLIAACSGPPAPAPRAPQQPTTPRPGGGALAISFEDTIRSLDPHRCYDMVCVAAVRLLYDGLYDYDTDGRLVPVLATALPEVLDSGRHHVITLREDLRFHDGRPLTAYDVVRSFERLLGGEIEAPAADQFANIEGVADLRSGRRDRLEGVRARSERVLEIFLDEPDSELAHRLVLVAAYPVDPESAGTERPNGTGPFQIVAWNRGEELQLARHEAHWDQDTPRADSVRIFESVDEDEAIRSFSNGELHMLRGRPAVQLADRLGDDQLELGRELPTLFGVAMNAAMPPFDDVHLRRAVAFAIDREAWSRGPEDGPANEPWSAPVPPTIPGFEAPPAEQTSDLERARAELALAGYEGGVPEPITVSISDGERARFFGELVVRDLARVGITVRIEVLQFREWLRATRQPGRVAMAVTGWNADIMSPSNFLQLFETRSIARGDNMAFFSDAQIDRWLEESRAEVDPAARLELQRRAAARVAELAPWAFAFVTHDDFAWDSRVRNHRFSPYWSVDIRRVWVADDE